jgi:RNA polymerase sigma-B factor
MATPRSPGTAHISVSTPPHAPARKVPQRGGAYRTANGHDRRGHDWTAQRAAALLMLVRMHQLEPGDRERARLREQVIAEYMSYARHLAARYGAGGPLSDDLRQVAYLGLVKAVDKFDPGYGVAFLSYATPMILGELKRHFRDHTWAVHVPRRIQELSGKVQPATETLTQRLHRDPTVPELAAILDADPNEVIDAIEAKGLHHLDSLDMPLGPNQSTSMSYGDLAGADDPGMQYVVDRETLRPLLARLPVRDKRILHLSFFRGMTQAQIGTELGVSQMQISRLLAAILEQLRQGAYCETAS